MYFRQIGQAVLLSVGFVFVFSVNYLWENANESGKTHYHSANRTFKFYFKDLYCHDRVA